MVSLGVFASLAALAYGTIHNRKALAKDIKPQTPTPLVAGCPAPSEKAISDVERLFTEPIARARAEYRKLPLYGYEREGSNMLPNLWGTSGEALLYYTEPYFNKFGIDVEAASAADDLDYGLHAPTEEELDSANMSNNVLGMVAGLSNVAPHYVVESGLRKILLVAGKGNTEFVWSEPHTLEWNINTPEPNLDPVPFEFGLALGHFTEDRICGPDGTDNDPAFHAAGNGPFPNPFTSGNIYNQKAAHVATLDEYHTGEARTEDVQVIDERATDGLAVDKAEILALVADPARVWSAMSPDHPKLRSKVIEALAELYQRQPAVVRRLAIKASRYPYVPPKANNNNHPAGSHHDFVFEDYK